MRSLGTSGTTNKSYNVTTLYFLVFTYIVFVQMRIKTNVAVTMVYAYVIAITRSRIIGTIYNTIQDWLSMAGLDNPDLYSINPDSPQAQQAAQQKAQQQQQQAQAAQQMQQAQMALVQEQLNLERMKLAQQAKADGDELAFKYWNARLNSEVDEMKLAAQGAFDLEKVQLQGEQREARNGAGEGATSN